MDGRLEEGGGAMSKRLKAGVVYEIEFRCTTPGPEVEEGGFTGYWTGETDTWGKRTFQPINGQPYYLFDRELVSVEAVAHDA
jgi:hypothetical protein